MSSRPPADNWDDLLSSFEGLQTSEPSALPSLIQARSSSVEALTVSTSTTPSGEFHPFIVLGSSLAEGGGVQESLLSNGRLGAEHAVSWVSWR
jgi:hypothetical protein